MIKEIFYAIISIIMVAITTQYSTAYGYISAIILIILYIIYFSGKDLINRQTKWKMPKIKDGVPTKWGWVVRHPENFELGENTDIGFGTYIQAENGVKIGKNVQIGSHCSIYSKNTIDRTGIKIIIEDNVRIGAGTIILPSQNGHYLYIGHDSVIGALSLVKQHILSNSVYAGIPTKLINDKLIDEGKSATTILEENYMK